MIWNESKNHNKKALPRWDGWSWSRRGVPVYDTWLDAYQNDLDKAGKILDLGCGYGWHSKYCAEHGISYLVLHYVEDLDAVYRKVYENLKSGGIFLLNIEHPTFTSAPCQD